MPLLGVFNDLLFGLGVALTPVNMTIVIVGLVLGTAVGVLPGLGGTNGVALLLPLTFTLQPTSAIILLASVYWGAIFGGAITSILFNIPGEPWSVATTFDGHPLAKQGKPGVALTAAFTSSFIGALVAIVLFTFFAPPLAELALRFGPPENFAVLFLAFATFAGLGGGSPTKTILMTLLGLLLSTVGFDIITGQPRMHFGLVSLQSGVNFIVIAIGLFGLGEIFLTVEEGLRLEGIRARLGFRDVWETWKLFPRYTATIIRSTILGFWVGVLPGTGATPASFMSYGLAKQFSKHPERFGQGEVEGVIAPETAAHAAGIGALLPMVTLGIPGSPTAAVMLAGFFIWGLNPGPLLFQTQRDFVWGLIGSMYVANVVGVLLVLTLVPVFAAINRIPFGILAPLIDHVQHRRVRDQQPDPRPVVHAGLRRRRISVQEIGLSVGAARRGAGPGRHDRTGPPTESDHGSGFAGHLCHPADHCRVSSCRPLPVPPAGAPRPPAAGSGAGARRGRSVTPTGLPAGRPSPSVPLR